MTIKIDLTRDKLFDDLGLTRLRESYMKDEETSPQERFAFVSEKFGSNPEHAQRLYDYSSKHWLSYSTPILSFGRSAYGLPISCFLVYVDDSAAGLVNALSETNWLSMLGGGVGLGLGIRSSDEKSTGILPHLKTYDASSLAYRQGRTRRGSYAAYLNISHPDIISFLEIRKPTGDPNIRCLNLHHGINITNDFMKIIEQCMIDPNFDDRWELIDPHSKEVKEVVSARDLWQRILSIRMLTGEPYIHFLDTANESLPAWQKARGLSIKQSNLCSEIELVSDKQRTAVCCLSSLNIEYFDTWKKDKQFIPDVVEMLDNVLQYFIDNAPTTISRAKYSALRERSIGIGALGLHSYFQKNNIPFESAIAKSTNIKIFKHIREQADAANQELGKIRGVPPDLEPYKDNQWPVQRLSHVLSIAPNASTSIIMGNCSPSVEPFRANAYRQDTLSGAHLLKNKFLDKIIKKHCEENNKNPDDIWSTIIANDGSCQHLTFLTDWEKDVFKTAMEIDQRWVIELASDRQKFIDQGQSINLFFRPNCNISYLHAVHFLAWSKQLKALYYCRSEKIGRADRVAKKIEREIIKEIDMTKIVEGETCLACEG